MSRLCSEKRAAWHSAAGGTGTAHTLSDPFITDPEPVLGAGSPPEGAPHSAAIPEPASAWVKRARQSLSPPARQNTRQRRAPSGAGELVRLGSDEAELDRLLAASPFAEDAAAAALFRGHDARARVGDECELWQRSASDAAQPTPPAAQPSSGGRGLVVESADDCRGARSREAALCAVEDAELDGLTGGLTAGVTGGLTGLTGGMTGGMTGLAPHAASYSRIAPRGGPAAGAAGRDGATDAPQRGQRGGSAEHAMLGLRALRYRDLGFSPAEHPRSTEHVPDSAPHGEQTP